MESAQDNEKFLLKVITLKQTLRRRQGDSGYKRPSLKLLNPEGGNIGF